MTVLRRHLVFAGVLLLLFTTLSLAADDDASEGGAAAPLPALEKQETPVFQPAQLEGRDLSSPGYGVPMTAKTPFQSGAAHERQRRAHAAAEEAEERLSLTEDLVQRYVHLGAVVSLGDKAAAVINRSLVRQGESFAVTIQEQPFTFHLQKLTAAPPAAVLSVNDRRYTITAGNPGNE